MFIDYIRVFFFYDSIVVGTWNNSSLSEDAVLIGRHASWLKGRRNDDREASKEQTEADQSGAGR